MRVVHEDHNRLIFKVYPNNLYTFGLFFIIAVMTLSVISLSHGTYEMLLNALLLGLFIAHTAITFMLPLTVKIDKSTNTLTYFYLSLFTYIFPNLIKSIFRDNPTLTIRLDHLKSIEVKNIYDGIVKPTFSSLMNKDTEGDRCIQFKIDNADPINFAPGFLSYSAHREACMKITEYLNIPFIDSYKAYKDLKDVWSL